MIGKLKGTLEEIDEDHCVVDVHGVGYVVFCSARTLAALPAPGEAVVLLIETYVREDLIRLYGFQSALEREWFRRPFPAHVTSEESSSLTDLNSVYDVVRTMQIIPYRRAQVSIVLLAAIIPMLPVLSFIAPIDEILQEMVRLNASDVHLTAGAPPMVRVSGALHALEGYTIVLPEPLRRSLYAILTQRQREHFEEELELDFSYAVRGLARFRVNIYQQRESIGAAFRVIPYEIKSLESLGLPPVISTFAGLPRGLVLVTGPTGSGKSTTLASIIDLANRTREDHIMTVEDPIEFLHRHKKCVVNQREVGQDTHSFANALKHVLRQDPDIILVGEMR
ncbi:MAG: Flp pilus assembly complex ATPase component TadA, partial [Myxococcales bacterium]|nr:Flp pilus assembly complex ATPase component TadA [Myxococcales bacterium]